EFNDLGVDPQVSTPQVIDLSRQLNARHAFNFISGPRDHSGSLTKGESGFSRSRWNDPNRLCLRPCLAHRSPRRSILGAVAWWPLAFRLGIRGHGCPELV